MIFIFGLNGLKLCALGFGSSDVSVDKKLTFTGNLPWTKAPTVLYAISVERGLSWENALEILNEHDDKNSGFYMSYHVRNF